MSEETEKLEWQSWVHAGIKLARYFESFSVYIGHSIRAFQAENIELLCYKYLRAWLEMESRRYRWIAGDIGKRCTTAITWDLPILRKWFYQRRDGTWLLIRPKIPG